MQGLRSYLSLLSYHVSPSTLLRAVPSLSLVSNFPHGKPCVVTQSGRQMDRHTIRQTVKCRDRQWDGQQDREPDRQ